MENERARHAVGQYLEEASSASTALPRLASLFACAEIAGLVECIATAECVSDGVPFLEVFIQDVHHVAREQGGVGEDSDEDDEQRQQMDADAVHRSCNDPVDSAGALTDAFDAMRLSVMVSAMELFVAAGDGGLLAAHTKPSQLQMLFDVAAGAVHTLRVVGVDRRPDLMGSAMANVNGLVVKLLSSLEVARHSQEDQQSETGEGYTTSYLAVLCALVKEFGSASTDVAHIDAMLGLLLRASASMHTSTLRSSEDMETLSLTINATTECAVLNMLHHNQGLVGIESVQLLTLLVLPAMDVRAVKNGALAAIERLEFDQQGFEVFLRILHTSFAHHASVAPPMDGNEATAPTGVLQLLGVLESILTHATPELSDDILAQQPFDPLFHRLGFVHPEVLRRMLSMFAATIAASPAQLGHLLSAVSLSLASTSSSYHSTTKCVCFRDFICAVMGSKLNPRSRPDKQDWWQIVQTEIRTSGVLDVMSASLATLAREEGVHESLLAMIQTLSVCVVGSAANVAHVIGSNRLIVPLIALMCGQICDDGHFAPSSPAQLSLGLHLWYNMHLTVSAREFHQLHDDSTNQLEATLATAMVEAITISVQLLNNDRHNCTEAAVCDVVVPMLRMLKHTMMTTPTERHESFMLLWQACQGHVVSNWNLLEQGEGAVSSSLGLEFADMIADVCSHRRDDCARFAAAVAKDIQYPFYSNGRAECFLPTTTRHVEWCLQVPVCAMIEAVHKLCSLPAQHEAASKCKVNLLFEVVSCVRLFCTSHDEQASWNVRCLVDLIAATAGRCPEFDFMMDIVDILQATAIQSHHSASPNDRNGARSEVDFPAALLVGCWEVCLLLLKPGPRFARLKELLELIEAIAQDVRSQECLLDAGIVQDLSAAISRDFDMPMRLFSRLVMALRRFGSLRIGPSTLKQIMQVVQTTGTDEAQSARRLMLLECLSDLAEGFKLRQGADFQEPPSVIDAKNPSTYALRGNPFGSAACMQFMASELPSICTINLASTPARSSWPPSANGYSISAWFRLKADPSTTQPIALLFAVSNPAGHALCRLEVHEQKLRFRIEFPRQPISVVFDGLSLLQLDQWHHVCLSHFHEKLMHSYVSVVVNGCEFQTVNAPYPSGNDCEVASMGLVDNPPGSSSPNCSTTTRLELGPLFVLKEPLSRVQAAMVHAAGPLCATILASHTSTAPPPVQPSLASTHVLQHQYLQMEKTFNLSSSHDTLDHTNQPSPVPSTKATLTPTSLNVISQATVVLAVSSRGWLKRNTPIASRDDFQLAEILGLMATGQPLGNKPDVLANDLTELTETPSRKRGTARRSLSLDWDSIPTELPTELPAQPVHAMNLVAFAPWDAMVVPAVFQGTGCHVIRASMAETVSSMSEQALEALLAIVTAAASSYEVYLSVRILTSVCLGHVRTSKHLVDSCMLYQLVDILRQKLHDNIMPSIVIPVLVGLAGCWRVDFSLEEGHYVPVLLNRQAARTLFLGSNAWTSVNATVGAELYSVLKQMIEAPCATYRTINRMRLRQLGMSHWVCYDLLQPEFQLPLIPAAFAFLFALVTQDDTFYEDVERLVITLLTLADFTHSKSHRSSLGGGGLLQSRSRSRSTGSRTLTNKKVRRTHSGLHTSLKRLQKDQLTLVRRFLIATLLKAMHHFHLLLNLAEDAAQLKKTLFSSLNVLRLLEHEHPTPPNERIPTHSLWAAQTSPAGRAVWVPRTTNQAIQAHTSGSDDFGKIGMRNIQIFAELLPADALMSMIGHFSDVSHNDKSVWDKFGMFRSQPKRNEPILAVLCLRALAMLATHNPQPLRKLCIFQELAVFVPHILTSLAAEYVNTYHGQDFPPVTEKMFIEFGDDPTRPANATGSSGGLSALPMFREVEACATLTSQEITLLFGVVIESIFDLGGLATPYNQLCPTLLDRWEVSADGHSQILPHISKKTEHEITLGMGALHVALETVRTLVGCSTLAGLTLTRPDLAIPIVSGCYDATVLVDLCRKAGMSMLSFFAAAFKHDAACRKQISQEGFKPSTQLSLKPDRYLGTPTLLTFVAQIFFASASAHGQEWIASAEARVTEREPSALLDALTLRQLCKDDACCQQCVQIMVAIGWDILTNNPKAFGEWEAALMAAPQPTLVMLPLEFARILQLVFQIVVADFMLEKLTTTVRIELVDSLLPGGLSTAEVLAQLKVYLPQLCHFAEATIFWEIAFLESLTSCVQEEDSPSHARFLVMLSVIKEKLQALVDFGTTLQNLHGSSQFSESHPPQASGDSVASKASTIFSRGRSSLSGMLGLSRKTSQDAVSERMLDVLHTCRVCLVSFLAMRSGPPAAVALALHVMASNSQLVMMTSPDKDFDQRFISVVCHHTLGLLLDDDARIRELAMAVWGCLLQSPLKQTVEALLQFNSSDASCSIDLTRSTDGQGFHLLRDVSLPSLLHNAAHSTTNASDDGNGAMEVVPAHVRFQSWFGSLSDDLRHRLESKLDSSFTCSLRAGWPVTEDKLEEQASDATAWSQRWLTYTEQLVEYLNNHTLDRKMAIKTTAQTEWAEQQQWIQNQIDRFAFALRERDLSSCAFEARCLDTSWHCLAIGGCRPNRIAPGGACSSASQCDQDEGFALGTFREVTFRPTSPRAGDWAVDMTEGPMRKRTRIRRSDIKLIFSSAFAVDNETASQLPNQSVEEVAQPLDLSSQLVMDSPTLSGLVSQYEDDAHSDSSLESDTDTYFTDNEDTMPPEDTEMRDKILQQLDADESDDSIDGSTFPDERGNVLQALSDVHVPSKRQAMRVQPQVEAHAKPQTLALSQLVLERKDLDVDGPRTPAEADRLSPAKSQSHDDVSEDTKKLRPFLMPNDDVFSKYNCERVLGMDTCKSLLLICHEHVYLLDGFQIVREQPSGNFIRRARANTERVVELDEHTHKPSENIVTQRSQYCRHQFADIVGIHRRRYLLRHVALELFLSSGQTLLIAFLNRKMRDEAAGQLYQRCPCVKNMEGVQGTGTFVDAQSVGSVMAALAGNSLSDMTEAWVSGEVTNFEYIMHLNTLAGRSFNDWTQYPVFPWVLADYTSEVLDLTNPATFRDFTKPMGAQSERREVEAREKYTMLSELSSESDTPFHFGTHYSSAGIILHYLVRLQPYAAHAVKLQSGRLDCADRLFSSVARSWLSASGKTNGDSGMGDVKELIPEFFTLPDFLLNINSFNLGSNQHGQRVAAVELPPWAHGNAREFIAIHNHALECDYVSSQLPHWIDLIFGYKQQGSAAEEACNVFHHLTYEGSVDPDSISDEMARQAVLNQIREFGQTPSQLFKAPHPAKKIQWSQLRDLSTIQEASSVDGSADGTDVASTHTPDPIGSRSRSVSHTFSEDINVAEINLEDHEDAMHQRSGSRSVDTTAWATTTKRGAQLTFKRHGIPDIFRRLRCMSWIEQRRRYLQWNTIGSIVLELSQQRDREKEKIHAVPAGALLLPPRNTTLLSWSYFDTSMRLHPVSSTESSSSESRYSVPVSLRSKVISAATCSQDGTLLLTGDIATSSIDIWTVCGNENATSKLAFVHDRSLSTTLHFGGISHLALSNAFNVFVSVCAGSNTVVLWDLNTYSFVAVLTILSAPCSCVRIDQTNGDILVAAGYCLYLFDVNGRLLASTDVRSSCNEQATGHGEWRGGEIMAVHVVTVSRPSVEGQIVFTGHVGGVLQQFQVKLNPSGTENCSHAFIRKTSTQIFDSTVAVTAVASNPNATRLYVGGHNGSVRCWRRR